MNAFRRKHAFNLLASIILLVLSAEGISAQNYNDTYLDTVKVEKSFLLNDYSSLGFEFGPSASRTMFSPTKKQGLLYSPQNFAVYYTKYTKMFGYMPYLAFKMGLRYSNEGYSFKEDKQTRRTPDVDGATKANIKIVDVPMMAMLHLDSEHFSAMADVGIYAGYRLSIERTGNNVEDAYLNDFHDYDRRFDYGLTGGIGFAYIFAPFEFQINANVRYSWGTLYDEDYYSDIYYRFAYPLDFSITAGVYYHLTKRTGRTRPQIKRDAYEKVYGKQK